MARLFVGVPAPPGLDLSSLADRLGELSTAKVVHPELYHVTLAFVGDVEDEGVDGVAEVVDAAVAAAAVDAHEGRVVGLGAFPGPSKARVAWVGLVDTKLDELAAAVRAGLAAADLSFDDRSFHAHLTVARFKRQQDLTALTSTWEGRELGPYPVDEVVLFRSELSPQGPTYERVKATALEAAR